MNCPFWHFLKYSKALAIYECPVLLIYLTVKKTG
jgi:hypothetical protein